MEISPETYNTGEIQTFNMKDNATFATWLIALNAADTCLLMSNNVKAFASTFGKCDFVYGADKNRNYVWVIPIGFRDIMIFATMKDTAYEIIGSPELMINEDIGRTAITFAEYLIEILKEYECLSNTT